MFHYYYALLHKMLATKSTKMDGPYESKIFDNLQSGRTQPGLKIGKSSTKWTNPTRVKYLTNPQSGRTLRGLNIWQVHKVDEPYEG